MEEIRFDSEYITLGQLLKMTDAIDSGGMAKWFLSENPVYINGEVDQRRGRKLRNKDVVNIPGVGKFLMIGPENGE
ncbi:MULTISPECIES: S4 domain-containing protein YaaA [Psychrobacillus]|uniref:S4 domain-containing protein YaaA n=1 Tax=Psychrobacillus faecigallinarum TaxID=2762235 RepID=A0ABR8RAP8_9BACI|nr:MULTISPECIES: S4 domain-containing protein YaaA [Psychrobacillus]MBD7944868.1 S4 domain-containing protein YaaA [Psychrobacillus faecigallinarum]QEY21386.1 S4 domain-containing protein YaaA [Psychrobacillus sp. AK 1817]QGM31897.1 S4 domain-containing protein YaaA [Bacillus sp. N3536]